jgi:hypothetical protein
VSAPERTGEEAEEGMRLFAPTSAPAEIASPSLRDKYMVPPFTVLDRRQGTWQERVRQWKKLGIEGELGMRSEEGRREGAGAFTGLTSVLDNEAYTGLGTLSTISIFDPFLTELAYHWFSPPGGVVLDPFAGGSVRGIVCGSMGRPYVGFDLNPEQVEANRAQADRIMADDDPATCKPLWVAADSRAVLAQEDVECDLVFTCPPYGDLEVYSDDPADLSMMSAAEFDAAYAEILAAAVGQLRPNRFAAIVVGNYRDKRGALRDLVGLTVRAMEDAGASFYNEAIIVDPVGTAAVRAPRQFAAQRKLVRTHQQMLVFIKGSAKTATDGIRQDSEVAK